VVVATLGHYVEVHHLPTQAGGGIRLTPLITLALISSLLLEGAAYMIRLHLLVRIHSALGQSALSSLLGRIEVLSPCQLGLNCEGGYRAVVGVAWVQTVVGDGFLKGERAEEFGVLARGSHILACLHYIEVIVHSAQRFLMLTFFSILMALGGHWAHGGYLFFHFNRSFYRSEDFIHFERVFGQRNLGFGRFEIMHEI
jgi:hypothetical protein